MVVDDLDGCGYVPVRVGANVWKEAGRIEERASAYLCEGAAERRISSLPKEADVPGAVESDEVE